MNMKHNIHHIKQVIARAEQDAHRKPGSVLLLAVTKTQKALHIEEVFSYGISHFGENYYQEALEKITQLQHLPLCWHFIGPIQSNKTKGIAAHFSWVHSVNRLKIAEALNQFRPAHLPPLNVCIQINLIEEESKSGINPEKAKELADAISTLPRLKLRGLMTIPPIQHEEQKQYDLLFQLNQLMHQINHQSGLEMDTLSMGMSDDLIPAIKAGATIVRIGRAIFGDRL